MYGNILDYFGKSFKLLFKNPILFIPVLFEIFIGVAVASVAGLPILMGVLGTSNMEFPSIGIGLIIIIATALIGIVIRAGHLNMMKESVIQGKTTYGDFGKGIERYFIRVLLGSLLMILLSIGLGLVSGLIALVFSVIGLGILGVILLSVAMIALVIFMSMWETILVYEDGDIIESIKLSFRFVKKHFGLMLLVNFLQGLLTGNNQLSSSGTDATQNRVDLSIPPLLQLFKYPSNIILTIVILIVTLLKIVFGILFFTIYDDRRDSMIKKAVL